MTRREMLAARFAAGRQRIVDNAEAGREELGRRAAEIQERFSEAVDADVVTNFAGWTIVSAGVAWGVTDWMRGRRMLRNLIGPIALLVLGTTLLSGGRMWQMRAARIGETEARVREEMRDLDPLARLRVLRDVAEESVPFVRRISVRN